MARRRLFVEAYTEAFGPVFAVFCAILGGSGLVILALVAAEIVRGGEFQGLALVIGAAIWVWHWLAGVAGQSRRQKVS
jgi:hypothetical protein